MSSDSLSNKRIFTILTVMVACELRVAVCVALGISSGRHLTTEFRVFLTPFNLNRPRRSLGGSGGGVGCNERRISQRLLHAAIGIDTQ